MFGLRLSPRFARIIGAVLLLASLFTLALGLRRIILLLSLGGVSAGEVPFSLESALQFRRVVMILQTGALPAHDSMIQCPEGIDPAATYTVFVDYLQAALCRIFPGSLSVAERLRWIESGWFCLSIPLLAMWARWATGRWSAGFVAGFLYAVSFASIERSTGAELSTENAAFPFLAAHFLCRAATRGADGRRRWWWTIGSAAALALAVVSWDLMQFYLFAWAGLAAWKILRGQWQSSDTEARTWLAEWAALVLVALFNPYHRAHGLLFSPAMLVASACALILAVRARQASPRKGPLPPVIFFGLCACVALMSAGNYSESYGHFLDLLWAKIRFHNIKRLDPSLLTFDQRLLWTPALHSPTFRLTGQILGVLCAVTLPAVWAVGRVSRNNLDLLQPLICFVFSALAFVFFYRFHVFVAFFGAMLAAAWWGMAARGEIRWAALVRGWIGLGLFAEAAHTLGGRLTREEVYFDEQVGLTKWLAKNAKPETVLAGFGISGPIAAYGKCGIVLHPKFESRAVRDKEKEYAEKLFTGTIKSFRDWAGRQGASYYVYGLGAFSTNQPTLQLRYMVNAMNPPPTAPARLFEHGKEDGHYFKLVYSNRKYRVFKIFTDTEEIAGRLALRRASVAFERGDMDTAEMEATAALRANPNLREAEEILKHVVALRGKGFSVGHEPVR